MAAHAEQVLVAVAANFAPVMHQLVEQFEANGAHKVKVAIGSSGKIYAQITNGAPFDLFFSADQSKPLALEQAGLTVNGNRFTYAMGGLALYSAIELVNAQSLAETPHKLAIANPRFAPYGVAAVALLAELGLTQKFSNKLILADNINQAYQFVATGNAVLGLVAVSQISDQPQDHVWVIPPHLYPPILQDVVLLQRAKDNLAAQQFLLYIQSRKAKDIMLGFGYKQAQ